jgi:hypothetical protein
MAVLAQASSSAVTAEADPVGAAWEDWDLVWCQPNGRPLDSHVNWEEWKALLREARITKDARLHDARHTCGTLLGELHVDMHVIQRILGHAQISTTRIYTDPTDPLTRDATDRMGRALWPEEQPPGGLSAEEARHAAALSECLASGNPERIRQALHAYREWADKAAATDARTAKKRPRDEGRRPGEHMTGTSSCGNCGAWGSQSATF